MNEPNCDEQESDESETSEPNQSSLSASPRWKKTIAATLIGIVMALSLGEATVRLSSKYFLKNYDIEMWRYARSIKRTTLPPVVHDHAPNASALLMGVGIRTDARGFRRLDAASEAKRRAGDRLIVTLGDSLTLGWGVPADQTLAAHLQRALPGATVINAGVGNSNTSMEVARYQRDIAKMHPDWVILGFFINDAEPDPVPKRSFILRHSALAAIVYGSARVRGEARLRNYIDYYRSLYDPDKPGWKRCEKALRELGAQLRHDNVKATLLLLPEMHEPSRFGPFASIYARVGEIGRDAGFEVIDGSVAFPAGRGNGYFVTPADAHPDGKAQKMFADAILTSRHARSSPTRS